MEINQDKPVFTTVLLTKIVNTENGRIFRAISVPFAKAEDAIAFANYAKDQGFEYRMNLHKPLTYQEAISQFKNVHENDEKEDDNLQDIEVSTKRKTWYEKLRF